MRTALVTGSAGLVGSETVRLFSDKGFRVVGIDNDMRKTFFGDEASTDGQRRQLESTIPEYVHKNIDIRDRQAVEAVFSEYGSEIQVVVHTAAQPSNAWSAKDPYTDFSVNGAGTLVMLETTRRFSPDAAFIFPSTYKVYGDRPNRLPLVEEETRWEIAADHPYYAHGIDEQMPIDQTIHSLFGTSKLAADLIVQEYGRFFNMNTVCFRCGCLTGPGQTGNRFHGLLSHLVQCAVTGEPYTLYGYKGKQVCDILHVRDLAEIFWNYYEDPRPGEVYNVGGGRRSNCSLREAIALCEEMTGRKMNTSYSAEHRMGDNVWYISDSRKFQTNYPGWSQAYDLHRIFEEVYESALAKA